MDRVIWSDSFSVGVKEIDDQHKVLLKLLNMQTKRSEGGQGLSDLEDMLKRLKKYSVIHFETEEKLFAKLNYPDAESHVKMHRAFIETIEEYEKDLKEKRSGLPEDLQSFLVNWYVNHIRKEDLKYGKFLKGMLK